MSSLHDNIAYAAVTPDDRGLMPLEAAREVVRGTDIYDRGEGREIDGTQVLDADIVWAALLSLEDAAEFVREANRIKWRFHVRGRDNVAAYERYGDALVPWIETHVDGQGVLRNVPWCLLPCLLACDGPAAYALARRIRSVTDDVEPTLARRALSYLADIAARMLRGEGRSVLVQWVYRHFETGVRLLAEDPARHGVLARVAAVDAGAVREVLGHERADGLELPNDGLDEKARSILAASPKLDISAGPPVLLGCLDAVCGEYLFPIWDNMNCFVAAMRVTGFAHPTGDALIFQALTCGSGCDGITEEVHGFGPLFGDKQWRWDGPGRVVCAEEKLSEWESMDTPHLFKTTGVSIFPDGTVVSPDDGPARTFSFSVGGSRVTVPLQPTGRVLATCGPTAGVAVALRDQLDCVLEGAALLRERLGLPEDAEPLFQFDSWQHPKAGEWASASSDIATMVEALRARRAISSLPAEVAPDAQLNERLDTIGGWGDPTGWG